MVYPLFFTINGFIATVFTVKFGERVNFGSNPYFCRSKI